MTEIKTNFSAQGEQTLASYNFQDLITNQAFATFYFGPNLTTNYMPTSNVSAGGSLFMSAGDRTYDSSPFVTWKLINGKATATIIVNNPSQDGTMYIRVYHVRGATATAISSSVGQAWNAGTTTPKTFLIPLTSTAFSKGDILRVVWSPNNNCNVYPSAADWKINIPFEVRL